MKELYSTYEAKAKLSEILRQVRAGKTIRISWRGVPVAEIRPIGQKPTNLKERLQELTERGVLLRQTADPEKLRPVAKIPGGLRRFLEERDR